jgi:hypothetical protein
LPTPADLDGYVAQADPRGVHGLPGFHGDLRRRLWSADAENPELTRLGDTQGS